MKNLKESWFLWIPLLIVGLAIIASSFKNSKDIKYYIRTKNTLDTFIITKPNIKEVMNILKINDFNNSNYEVLYFNNIK